MINPTLICIHHVDEDDSERCLEEPVGLDPLSTKSFGYVETISNDHDPGAMYMH